VRLGLGPSLVVAVVALPACASSVPWPPRDGSCIEAHRETGRMGETWRYAIAGREARLEEVRSLLEGSPSTRARFHHHHTMDVVAVVLLSGGVATSIGGFVAAGAESRPLLYLLSVAGVAIAGAGIAVGATNVDPFREAVWQYNLERPWPCSPSATEPPVP
jgi:hypothetical protein